MFSWQQKKNAIKDIDIKINVLNVTANRAQRPMYFMQKSLVCFFSVLQGSQQDIELARLGSSIYVRSYLRTQIVLYSLL